jgi:DNA-binding CsgD family transcriptional regulator
VGYLLLSIAEFTNRLPFATAANTVVYLGSVFLTPCLYMSVRRLCSERRLAWLKWGVIGLALLVFGAIATTPWTGLYYKEVMFDQNGLFDKVYGPLHPLYKVYLIAYFVAMIVTVARSLRRQRFPSQKQAALITAIVFGNITLWLVEQIIPGPFEYMAAFYLFSEMLLLGLHWLMQDTVHPTPTTPMEILLSRLPKGVSLHPREQEVLTAILDNVPRKEIASRMNLSENTIKTYTRNLYHKLGVSSREELYALLP